MINGILYKEVINAAKVFAANNCITYIILGWGDWIGKIIGAVISVIAGSRLFLFSIIMIVSGDRWGDF